MRLYNPHAPTLQALGGSGIELMVGIPDSDLPALAKCQCHANSWVHGNITLYPDVKFRYIVVGNEVNTSSPEVAPFVLQAMQNIYNAVCTAGLESQIAVSTSIKTDLLETSYPPNAGAFRSSVAGFIKPIVEFLSDTGAPLLVNVYPYFAYMDDPKNISLAFALLQPNSGVYIDCVYYDNLFYAIVDAVYAAMDKILAPPPSSSSSSSSSLQAMKPTPRQTVSESGHSTRPGHKRYREGDGELSTVENARIYNNNLMRIVKKGTPKRPNTPIETYIFAMFDEDLKQGEEYERHFGIFLPSGEPKYTLRFY